MNFQKIAKAITLVGLATTMTGLTFKLNHLMGAPIIFNLGVAILVIGLRLVGIWIDSKEIVEDGNARESSSISIALSRESIFYNSNILEYSTQIFLKLVRPLSC